MRSEVSITFKGASPVRIDLNEVQPMPHVLLTDLRGSKTNTFRWP